MKFPSPLMRGQLIQRYKRFLADIILESGEVITAHCANSGSLLHLIDPGTIVWVAPIPQHSVRQLRYDWFLLQDHDSLVGINTAWANKLVEEAIINRQIFADYHSYKREVKYGENSRIDFILTHSDRLPFYLEVKNVTHYHERTALFPDSVTARGTKHMNELIKIKAQGFRAGVLYVIQRTDCDQFSIADTIDPLYAAASKTAQQQGVEFWAHLCQINPHEITLDKPITLKI